MIVLSLVSLLMYWSVSSMFSLFFSLIFFGWLLLVYVHYIKTLEYGTDLAFYYSLAFLINYSLIATFFLFFAISLPFLNLLDFDELQDVNPIGLYLSLIHI